MVQAHFGQPRQLAGHRGRRSEQRQAAGDDVVVHLLAGVQAGLHVQIEGAGRAHAGVFVRGRHVRVQGHGRHAGGVLDARLGQSAAVVLHHLSDFLEIVHRGVGHEQHAAALSADVVGGLAAQDGHVQGHRILHRPHVQAHLADRIELALVRDALASQQAFDQHQVFVETLPLGRGIQAIAVELVLQVARPDPQRQPAL
ncbi:hypothetical protein D9M68_587810 [compost metagenome]